MIGSPQFTAEKDGQRQDGGERKPGSATWKFRSVECKVGGEMDDSGMGRLISEGE